METARRVRHRYLAFATLALSLAAHVGALAAAERLSTQKPIQDSPEQYRQARKVLDEARSLRCEFPLGWFVDVSDARLTRHEGSGSEVIFDAIDRRRGRAPIVAKAGAGDVSVFTGATALTFLELSATGNPLVTVVFPQFRAGTRKLLAVDSEHICAMGGATVGQYYGTCTVLE